MILIKLLVIIRASEIIHKVYRAYVQSVLEYASETWAMKVEDTVRLERTERMVVR